MSRMMALVAALLIASVWCESSTAQQAPTAGAQRPAGGLAGAAARAGAAETKASPAEEEIEAALAKPVKFQFDTVPLVEVIDFFANQFDINIQLDPKGLTDAAVDSQAAVTKAVRKPIPLESALRLILDEFDLTITIQNNVLLVTSKEKADEILETRVYAVGDLLGRRPQIRSYGIRIDPLAIAITTNIHPDFWNDNGGPGSISQIGTTFVIAQTRTCHNEIKDLLTQLRARLADPGADNQAAKDPTTMTTVVYQLGTKSAQEITEAITGVISPSTWESQGGRGKIRAVARSDSSDEKGGKATPLTALVVNQTQDVHDQIQELIDAIVVGHSTKSGMPTCFHCFMGSPTWPETNP